MTVNRRVVEDHYQKALGTSRKQVLWHRRTMPVALYRAGTATSPHVQILEALAFAQTALILKKRIVKLTPMLPATGRWVKLVLCSLCPPTCTSIAVNALPVIPGASGQWRPEWGPGGRKALYHDKRRM